MQHCKYILCVPTSDSDWVSPRSDLIDYFPERSMYPAGASLIRHKRVAVDGLAKSASAEYNRPRTIRQYVDPMSAARLKSEKLSKPMCSFHRKRVDSHTSGRRTSPNVNDRHVGRRR